MLRHSRRGIDGFQAVQLLEPDDTGNSPIVIEPGSPHGETVTGRVPSVEAT
ncbi:hypothetical protein [Haloarcula halophila]|uniref:hypothetical protein n=1 Tax=Haloarcula TaxID=2237 RepID=UPI0023E410BF|nr:hypothetical protein [Halomicroarcula sp. DFY41]